MSEQGEILDSVNYVTERVEQTCNVTLNKSVVRDVLRKEVGATFKKVKQISLHENSVKNLILR